ncbi:hypothetical protein ACO2Q7_11435 [Rathayibacter sp. KR2-224]|uniref:hypothetical protein n=1 Tax=Rathayibacter sp. KR2-224 TaxID=3400913 RepID=UPI003BFEA8B3
MGSHRAHSWHPTRIPLPPELRGSSFRAAGPGPNGLGRGRLRAGDVDAPFHGIRSVDVALDDPIALARAYAPRLRPGQFYCHTTAALLWGIPLPLELEQSLDVHVGTTKGSKPRTRGVVGHEFRPLAVRHRNRMPVTTAADTWCHLSSMLSREDLVAAGDFLISGQRIRSEIRTTPLCTPADLADAASRYGRTPGAAGIRWALPRLRAPVDSRRESLLRLLLVEHGLPEPVVAHPVAVAGGVVLHPDLSYPALKIAIEYEGDEHRSSKRRWREDLRRVRLLEEAGWRVFRVTDDELNAPAALVRAIRSAATAAS